MNDNDDHNHNINIEIFRRTVYILILELLSLALVTLLVPAEFLRFIVGRNLGVNTIFRF